MKLKSTPRTDKVALAKMRAEILDHINYLHPFREGNGRAQREFMRLLALEKGYYLNLNPPDEHSVYQKYMQGTIESNVELLEGLILNHLEDINN